MDTFTIVTAAMTLFMIHLAESRKIGAYHLLGAIFAILLAWRMAEEIFYIGTGALLFVLIFRTFFSNEDVRENDSI